MACGCQGSISPSGWEMQNICTLYDAVKYVKRRLGEGALCVQMTDQQLLDCCCQALRMAYRYLSGEATHRDFLIFKIIRGVTEYHTEYTDKDGNLVEGNVFTLVRNNEGKLVEAPVAPDLWCSYTSAWDFSLMNILGGINTLHSATNMYLSTWVRDWNYHGGTSGIVGYDAAMTFLKEVDKQFGPHFSVNFHEGSHTLQITPTPIADCFGLLQIWRKEEAYNLLNNPLILDLMEGYSLQLLGRILSKYQVTLAGGGQLNGEIFFTQGKDLVEATLERLRTEAEPPYFFVM